MVGPEARLVFTQHQVPVEGRFTREDLCAVVPGAIAQLAVARLQQVVRHDGAVSRDGERIAYIRGELDGRLQVMRSDGTGARDVTQLPANWPEWLSNRRLVFVSRGDLYAANDDGTMLRRLTDTAANEETPAPSPDGSLIAFVRRVGADPGRLFVMNADGGGERELVADHDVLTPTWSPDGRTIAFSSARLTVRTPEQLFLYDVATGRRRQLSMAGGNQSPAFSPDGTKLAFARALEHGAWDVWIKDLRTGRETNATRTTFLHETAPSWQRAGAPQAERRDVCALAGTDEKDVLRGGPGGDFIFGNGGDDRISGLTGADQIDGGPGRDFLRGGSGNDRIVGGAGGDRLHGGRGRDRLFARDGARDWLFGGPGVDTARVDHRDRRVSVEQLLR